MNFSSIFEVPDYKMFRQNLKTQNGRSKWQTNIVILEAIYVDYEKFIEL